MSETGSPQLRVNVAGGSALTRDLFCFILSQAGMDVRSETVPVEPCDLRLVIAEGDEMVRLMHDYPAARSVVVADVDVNDEAVVDLILEGADAVVGLDSAANDLAEAVRVVAAGGTLLAPKPARRLSELARTTRAQVATERALLTSRELDILLSIGRGESVKQTARTLGISAKTVENLQSRLFRKLDVRNRAQAFAHAHAMGLLPLPQRHVRSTPAGVSLDENSSSENHAKTTRV